MAEKLYFPEIYLVPALTWIILKNQSTIKFGQNNSPKMIQSTFFYHFEALINVLCLSEQ